MFFKVVSLVLQDSSLPFCLRNIDFEMFSTTQNYIERTQQIIEQSLRLKYTLSFFLHVKKFHFYANVIP